jgi:hypothetical protein
MEEEKIQAKKPDEIYCPNCAKLVNKDAVVCPNCGIQVKELKVSPETIVLKSFEKNSDGANYLFETDVNTLANYVYEFFKAEGYELQEGNVLQGGYLKGSLASRVMFGGFAERFKFNVNISDKNGMAYLVLSKGMSGFSGGLIGLGKMNNETDRLRMKLYNIFIKK